MVDLPLDDAADAAIEMQLAIAELPPVGNTTLGIRIGFNFGPVVERARRAGLGRR